ncbi:TadE-like protein [Serinibacter salmoneus]|uniref:TadE-like protein n=2 Tax=Serinibacter salmoneus TaxID=556530 RepID=A0A2A9CYH6_9MICO|nr:TadE-like protein [Serinibacter salmoneus]
MVGALVLLVILALVQLTLALWVRTMLIDAAAEGARYAALEGSSLEEGTQRTREVIAMSLGAGYEESVTARAEDAAGWGVIVVEVQAPMPVLGLLGPSGGLSVTGRAAVEQ